MVHAGVQSIIWTQGSPAYGSVIYRSEPEQDTPHFYPVAEDINKLQGWIEREIDLAKIRNYERNWDGFDADAPDPKIVDAAVTFLRSLRKREDALPPARIALSPNGSVTLDWMEGSNFVRAEIENPNQIDWMRVVPGQPTEFNTEDLSVAPTFSGAGQIWQIDEPAFVSTP